MNQTEDIFIGFAEKINQNANFLTQQNLQEDFPSLLGGQPLFLHKDKQLEEIKCSLCGNLMVFLLQLYAPLEYNHAYHRILYVFFCKNEVCQNNNNSIKVLRVQQTKNSPFAPLFCQNSNKLNLESYQIVTDVVSIKESIELEKEFKQKQTPFEVDDKEFSKKTEENYEKENVLMKQFIQLAFEDNQISQQIEKYNDDDDEDEDEADDCFDKYVFVLKKQGPHVVRYCRSKNTEPLWYSDKKQWQNIKEKKCSKCQKRVIFEFQINSSILELFPSLISYDWGIIAIYSCENSCVSEENFVEEVCYLQVLLEKEQIEENIKKFMKNQQKYCQNGDENQEEESKNQSESLENNNENQIQNEQNGNTSQKQKKKKKKNNNAKQENKEENKEENENSEDW